MRRHAPTSRLKMPGHPLRILFLLGVAATLSGCAGVSQGSGPFAAQSAAQDHTGSVASASNGAQTVAFESVDGPPPQVFDRFVHVLQAESQARNVAIQSRNSAASYRIRSYLAAHVRQGRTTIAWVWDVYDHDQQRALRVSGEEDGGKVGRRDAWAVADDRLLRRIAQTGLMGLSGFINGTTPSTPARNGRLMASADSVSSDLID